MIHYRSKLQRRIEQSRTFHQELHAERHHFLLLARLTDLIQILPPTVNLLAQIDLYRTNVRARKT